MRLIDLNKIPHKAFRGDRDDLVDALFTAPTVDAVPVVRCKDCKHSSKGILGMMHCKFDMRVRRADWFCADGERKGGGE